MGAASWRIEYLDGQEWKPVQVKGDYAVAADRWCEVTFAPVTTTALRLNLKLQDNWAAGILEWKVTDSDDL